MNDNIVATSSSGDTIRVGRINQDAIEKVKESLKRTSCNAKAIGLTDSDLLIALGAGRDTFDLFGVFCTFWGRMMQFLGTTVTVAISLFSVVLFIEWVVSRVSDFADWMKGLIGGVPLFMAKSFLSDANQPDMDGLLSRMTSEGIKGFVYGLLPPPIGGALGAIIGALNVGASGPSTAGPAPSGATGIVGPALGAVSPGLSFGQSALGALSKAIPSAIDKVLSLLGGRDADVDFSPQEIDALAAATGRDPSHVRNRLLAETARKVDEQAS